MNLFIVMFAIVLPFLGQSQMDCEAIEPGYSGSCKTLHSDNTTIKIEGSCVNGRIVEMTRHTEKSKIQEHGKFNPDSLVGIKNIYTKKGKLSRIERINGDSLIVDILDKSGNRKIKISTSKKSDYATWEYFSKAGELDSSVIYSQYSEAGYFRHNCPYLENPTLKN